MAELTMTVQDFVNAGACYSRSQLKKLYAGREALSALNILELDIPDVDKLWAVLREELIPARTLHLLAVEFARAALVREREAGREPDDRCWRALDVKLAWLDGKASDDELDAAIADANAAADAATKAATKATADAAAMAANAAAKATADAVAWIAADAAANATNTADWAAWAARAAARAANAAAKATADAVAWAAARAEQVDIVKRMLRGER